MKEKLRTMNVSMSSSFKEKKMLSSAKELTLNSSTNADSTK